MKLNLLLLFYIFSTNTFAEVAYNTFQEMPFRFGQEPGWGYYGGGQQTDFVFGVSFIPNVSGSLTDIWVAVGTSLSNPGTGTLELAIATSTQTLEPEFLIAAAIIEGAVLQREQIVHIPAAPDEIFLEEGTMYWLLIGPGEGTPSLAWLGGPPNSPPGTYSTYPHDSSPTGWFVSPTNSNGAMRIDVSLPITTPIPNPNWVLVVISLLLGYIGIRTTQRKHYFIE